MLVVVGRRLIRGLLKTKLEQKVAGLEGASGGTIAQEKKRYAVDLEENMGPINEFGKTYNRTQLYHLYRYVEGYCLGLPAFGLNILRSMHVTAVLTRAVKKNKKHDDPEIVNLFAQARHGIFEREKTWNMVKRDLQMADESTFQGQNHGLA